MALKEAQGLYLVDLLLGAGLGFQVLDPVQSRGLVRGRGSTAGTGVPCHPQDHGEEPLPQGGAHQELGLTPARISHLWRAESSRLFITASHNSFYP